jgi:hypothetical protein
MSLLQNDVLTMASVLIAAKQYVLWMRSQLLFLRYNGLSHAGCLHSRKNATDRQTNIDGPIMLSLLTLERERLTIKA